MKFLRTLLSKIRALGGTAPSVLGVTATDAVVLKQVDSRIVVGKIEEILEHPDPNITKVRVTKTRVGDDVVQVLCGGSNIAVGQLVPVATVGADLGGGFVIGKREIRGQESCGMICAQAELGMAAEGEQKGHIWSLPADAAAHIGTPLRDLV